MHLKKLANILIKLRNISLVVAHKGRHKLQDKWEPEEYVVIEQPIAGKPVYKVQPVNGDNITQNFTEEFTITTWSEIRT